VLAAPGPRIYIATDLEGVGGVNSWDEQVTPGQRRFEEKSVPPRVFQGRDILDAYRQWLRR
jgi:hypothetical protein